MVDEEEDAPKKKGSHPGTKKAWLGGFPGRVPGCTTWSIVMAGEEALMYSPLCAYAASVQAAAAMAVGVGSFQDPEYLQVRAAAQPAADPTADPAAAPLIVPSSRRRRRVTACGWVRVARRD